MRWSKHISAHSERDPGVARGCFLLKLCVYILRLPRWLSSEDPTCGAGDPGSIPGSGRSTGGRNSNPLQDFCLGNPLDRGAWRAAVHGVAKSCTRQSDSAHTHLHSLQTLSFSPRDRAEGHLTRFTFFLEVTVLSEATPSCKHNAPWCFPYNSTSQKVPGLLCWLCMYNAHSEDSALGRGRFSSRSSEFDPLPASPAAAA